MNLYIEQLLEDIRLATEIAPKQENSEEAFSNEDEPESYFEDVGRYISGADEKKLSDILGIPLEVLPNPGKLTERQIGLITDELIKLLNAWNFYPDFPDGLPDHLKYKALLGIWENDFTQLSSGETHIEFCSYDQENCPFPGYCSVCNEIMEKEPGLYGLNGDTSCDLLANENISQDRLSLPEDYPEEEIFIPGIYNYCDGWCERCNFTKRCRNFATAREIELEFEQAENIQNKDPEQDQHPEITNDKHHELFDEQDFNPEEKDVFFNADPDEEEYYREQNDFFSPRKKAERHPLTSLTNEYSMAMHDWLKINHGKFMKNLTTWLAKGSADEMNGAFDNLFWYHLFIHVKMRRALNGYYEAENLEGSDYDMNGTAKVMLIGIDYSLDALRILRRYLKTEITKIDQFRKQLEKIRFMSEELFPKARNFIRPGLDE